MLFSVTIYYLRQSGKIQQIQWDCQTLTAGDYTVELDITDEGYNWFKEHELPDYQAKGMGPAEGLKQHLTKELETILSRDQRGEGTQPIRNSIKRPNLEIKIVDIAFAYNNAKLISLLQERGKCIVYQKYERMHEIENEISELKKNQYDDFTKPVCAFITFEEEAGVNRALDYEKIKPWVGSPLESEQRILGGTQELEIKPASEPTNIIWQNRQIEGKEKLKRMIISLLIIVFLISASFTAILMCKQYSIKVGSKYPTVSCDPIASTYGANYEQYAFLEFDNYYNVKPQREFTGVLPCFCQAKIQEIGYLATEKYEMKNAQKTKLCSVYI